MKVQKAISIETDELSVLLGECKREEIQFSDYIREAIFRLGPLTYELAGDIRRKKGMGIWRDAFFSSREVKVEVSSEPEVREIPAPFPHKAY